MDADLLFTSLAIFFLLLCSGFFSGSETALTAISRARVFQLVKENNKRAIIVSRLRNNKESLIGAILLGNNLVNILASALATSLAISVWGPSGVAYVTLIMTVLVLIFAEVLPKTFAIKRSEQVSLFVAPLIRLIVLILSPITRSIKWLIDQIFRALGIDTTDENAFISATDILRGTIEMHHRQGQMEKQDRDMLGGILELEEIDVEEVMIHRKKVQGLDIEASIDTIIEEAITSPHSRLPMYQGDYNNIIGILHIKRLLKLIHQKGRENIHIADIRNILTKPWYIPATTSLKNQLYAFRQRCQHFALVVDEYGSLLGIVTLEDVIEEIVGEIDDEYDTIDINGIVELSPNSWLVEGNTSIRDLNRHLDWQLPDEEANTIAGLLLHEARDIPEVGDQFVIAERYHFTVEARNERQIHQVRVKALPVETEDNDL